MALRKTAGAFALVAVLASPLVSRADVGPPPDECSAGKKKEGEACKDFGGQAGACGTITYTRTFNPPFSDASPSVSTQSYFGCKAGAAPTSSTGSAGKKCSVAVVGASWPSRPSLVLPIAIALGLSVARRRR
jgi:hypothetical protein